MSDQGFKIGTHIEVTSDEDGFRGAWYLAKIIEGRKSDECLIEYHELFTDENYSNKLIECVHVSCIRPLAPVENGDEVIEVNDVVDAFHRDGWWCGVVVEVLNEGRKFLVGFDDPPDTMEFNRSDIRVHFDWVHGKWEKPQKKDTSGSALIPNHSEKSKRPKKRAVKKQAGKDYASKEKKDNSGVHVENVEKECIAKEVDVSLQEVKGVSATFCETPWTKDQKKKSRDQEIHTVNSTNGSTEGNNSSKRKRGRPKMLTKKQIGEGSTEAKSSSRETVMKDSGVGDEAELTAEKDCLLLATVNDKPNEDHFQLSSKSSMKVSTTDKKLTSGVHSHNDLPSKTAIPLPEDQADGTVSRKRVNQPINSLSSGHEEMSEIVDSESRRKSDDMLIDEHLGDIIDDQPLIMLVHNASPMFSCDSRALLVQDQCANANGRQDDFGTSPVAKRNRMEPSPLQKKDSPNQRDLPVKNLNQRAGSNDKSQLGTPTIVSIYNVENNQSLFVKSSPVWKTIESMEIFKKMAQKPHFSPLVKFKEDIREGLAVSHMINFSNLVEKITQIQFSHPITVIESSLETLADLESHGFDVETVRSCLTQLLSKKQRGEELEIEYQNIGNEISNSVHEKVKDDEEITHLYQKMREFETKVGEAVLRKEVKEKLISTLQSKQDVVSKNVQSVQLDFESIAGSLL